MVAFIEAWGGGNGAARRLSPHIRLLCGALFFSGATLTPPRPAALSFGIAAIAGWAACCGLPRRRLRGALALAASLFLPLAALAWAAARLNGDTAAWRVPAVIVLRSTLGIVAAAATMAALDLAELHDALAALPLPRAVRALLLQVAQQTALLTDETRRLGDALRIRGLVSARLATRVRGLCALPTVWLVRLALRAERVGAAMEVRGFDGGGGGRRAAATRADRAAVSLALLVLGVAGWLRWRGM